MALETRLIQKLSQNLLMTPQLQQAIKLLQLGRMDFIEAIENEILENPLLEEYGDFEISANASDSSLNSSDVEYAPESRLKEEVVGDWDRYLEAFHDSGMRTGGSESDYRSSLEEHYSPSRSLIDDLNEQILDLNLSSEEKDLVHLFLGNLDSRGYLQITLAEIAEISGADLKTVEQIHQLVLTLDPIGVGSRDIRECLLVQLDRLGKLETVQGKIVLNYLNYLESRRYAELAKILFISLDELKDALRELYKLDPYPARQYSSDDIRYIVPDVYCEKVGDEYQIILNEDGLPRLRISNDYTAVLRNHQDKNLKDYYSEMFKSANWLIRSIDQRQRTIFKVAQSIIKFQRDFLDYGLEYLRPLILKEVADDIEMHESTVSRVTNNKYIQTPQGIFELKFFFTPGLRTNKGEISSSAVKDKIKKIIDSEDPSRPISDQRIVELLQDEKIEIARRTVAKYREVLGIAPSSHRKRAF